MATAIGDVLRSARMERGLSLSDAAEDTAISKRKLQALEDEQWNVLEGDVYVKSSLRLYGRFLHIDPEPLVEAYRREFGEVSAAAPVQAVGSYHERISPVVAFAVVALVVIIGLGIIGSLNGDGETGAIAVASEAIDSPDAQGPAPATPPEGGQNTAGELAAGEAAPTPTPDPSDTPPLADAEKVELALNVSGGASWVRITIDEEKVLERTLEDGFSETFTGDQIQMRIGNGGAADVIVNGEQLEEFSTGEVVDVVCAAGQSSCVVE